MTKGKISVQKKQKQYNKNNFKNVLKGFREVGTALVQIIELLEMEVDNLKKITLDNNENNL